MDLSPQQQPTTADMKQDLWEGKLQSIIAAGEQIEDILNGKDTASPPMASSMPTSSDAGQAPAADILTQAISDDAQLPSAQLLSAQLPSAQLPSAQPPSAQLPSAQLPSAQLPSAQLPSAQLPSAQLSSAQLPSAQLLSAQLTHGREALVQQGVIVNNSQTPVKPPYSRNALFQQDGNVDNTSPPYMKMIVESIMASPMKRVVLCQVYSYIEQRYPKFTESKRSWKNNVRHNLSTNKCFQRCDRALSGRGYIWQIHPACLQMFQCGNFIRRDALCAVYRYERENRMSVDGQQGRNIGVSLHPQSIPQQQPQNSAVTTSARMPHQYQQMQQTQVYVPPMLQSQVYAPPMIQLGPLSNTEGQYVHVNTQSQHVGTQGPYVSSQGQYVCTQGQYAGTQGQYGGTQGQYAGTQGQFSISRDQHMRNLSQGEYLNSQNQQTSTQGQCMNIQSQFANTQGQYTSNQCQNNSLQPF